MLMQAHLEEAQFLDVLRAGYIERNLALKDGACKNRDLRCAGRRFICRRIVSL